VSAKPYLEEHPGAPVPWAPAPREPRACLGTLGESVLSAISVAQIHGIIIPSYMELRREAAADPQDREAVLDSLRYSLAIELGAAGLIWLVFNNLVPAAVAAGTSLILYALGRKALTTPL
jgi:hypothetical protein